MPKYKIFIGTYSKGPGNGLFYGEFDENTGEIRINDTLDIENPSYLKFNNWGQQDNQNILYGVSEVEKFSGENGGALFSVDISDPKKMRLIDIKCTHGKSPCHLCVIDNLAFTANYSEGSLSVFEIAGSGNIKPSNQSVHHFGKSVNPQRQESSHIHFAEYYLGKYIAVCDLGLDKVFLYPYFRSSHSKYTGLITDADIIDCPPGSGPRHLAASKINCRYLYVLTELQSTILVYKFNDDMDVGKIELIQEISALPSDFTGNNTCAAIHVSPDGKFVAASNRGHDSIAIFEIQDNGELVLSNHIMTGKEPRDFSFSPDNKWILSANQNSDYVSVYKIEDNKYTQTSGVIIPKPVCILFGKEI